MRRRGLFVNAITFIIIFNGNEYKCRGLKPIHNASAAALANHGGCVKLLSHLHIENVAVIENVDMELDSGLNVLTGETGAGKSILIDAINMALGERISKDIVRTGAKKAHVSALFVQVTGAAAQKAADLGFDVDEDGCLLIQRDISAQGKSMCRVQGRVASVSILREIGRTLVNTHGQHDNQALLEPENHIGYLDKYADLTAKLKEYAALYGKWKQLAGELKALDMDEAYKARKVDLLTYQTEEIKKAALEDGEEEELQKRKQFCLNAEKISEAVNDAYAKLSGGEETAGAEEQVSAASESLNAVKDVYPEVREIAERLSEASYEISGCLDDLRAYAGDFDYDPKEIDDIEARLDTIFRLKKKYGGSIKEIKEFYRNAAAELGKIQGSEKVTEDLQKKIAAARSQTAQKAAEISALRRKAAGGLQQKIKSELEFLDMPGVQFVVDIRTLAEPSENGADGVEFLISANRGEPPRPIAKIASGGELSRIMLAIKNVLADNDDIETSIFDEIDTGVSGRAAHKIGLKLKETARGRQIICVTHLAQIACMADRHILIEKTDDGGKTRTTLKLLDYEGRKQELARIIGGEKITDLTLGSAGEMLREAGCTG